ncbi:uncharacterized protein [Amphiura filiformis]|uniref:uncharacterized protein isoform X2 n=1 Tax=Amphiura filiformis TaxID=82378 RepID=UPI003B225757
MANESRYLALCSVFVLFLIHQVACVCDSYGYGYQNVKENGGGFLRWEPISETMMNQVYPEEVGPSASYDVDDTCYWLARNGGDGDRALLLSPCYNSTSSNVGLSFAYYLYGENAGRLSAYLRNISCTTPQNFMLNNIGTIINATLMGSQRNNWVRKQEMIGIPQNFQFQIVFEAVMKGYRNNSIAIDAIEIENASTLAKTEPPPVARTSTSELTTTKQTTEADVLTSTQVTSTEYITSEAITTSKSNVTLNFCERDLVVQGLDNCTFIGLMFAIVPLGLIFLIWLVCCTFNRYIRKVGQSDRRQHDDNESSMGKDNYLSNSYAYINSTTDHTYAYIPGNVLKTDGATAQPDDTRKAAGVTSKLGDILEMDKAKVPEGNNEDHQQYKDRDMNNKTSPGDGHIYEETVNKSHEKETNTTLDEKEDAHHETNDIGDPMYNVLDGPTPDGDPLYNVLDGATRDDDYDELKSPQTTTDVPDEIPLLSSKDGGETGKDVASVDNTDVTEESPYHVLDGPPPPSPPPSPPHTPIPRLGSRKTNADERYETVEVDNSKDGTDGTPDDDDVECRQTTTDVPQTDEIPLLSNQDGAESGKDATPDGDPLYNVLDGATRDDDYQELKCPQTTTDVPDEIPLLSNQDGAETGKDVASVDNTDVTEESPYHVLDGPPPPSPPPSPPHTPIPRLGSRKTNADERYETVEVDNPKDGTNKNVVLSSVPKTTANDPVQIRSSCIEPYADSMVGEHYNNENPVDENANLNAEEPKYETIAIKDEDGYDDPRIVLVRSLDSAKAEDSDDVDDTYL